MNNKIDDKLIRSLLCIAVGFLIIAWLILQDTNLAQQKDIFHYRNGLPVLTVLISIMMVLIMKKIYCDGIEKAKLKQKNDDCNNFIKILNLQIKNYAISFNNIKSLSRLCKTPQLAMFLIEKTLDIDDEYNTKLTIDVDDNVVINADVEKLKNCIDLMFIPIFNSFKDGNKGEITLLIRDVDDDIIIKMLFDYIGNPVQTEMTEWQIKKALQKCPGKITTSHIKEEDILVAIFELKIPKGNKVKRIV